MQNDATNNSERRSIVYSPEAGSVETRTIVVAGAPDRTTPGITIEIGYGTMQRFKP